MSICSIMHPRMCKHGAMMQQHEERERCGRTVYVANVDERLEAADVRRFFSKFCGKCMSCSLLTL
jgi:ribosomal protein S27AE